MKEKTSVKIDYDIRLAYTEKNIEQLLDKVNDKDINIQIKIEAKKVQKWIEAKEKKEKLIEKNEKLQVDTK